MLFWTSSLSFYQGNIGRICRYVSKDFWSKSDLTARFFWSCFHWTVFTWHLDWQQSDWKYPPFTTVSSWVHGKCFCSLAVMGQVWIEGWEKSPHCGRALWGTDTPQIILWSGLQIASQAQNRYNSMQTLISMHSFTMLLCTIRWREEIQPNTHSDGVLNVSHPCLTAPLNVPFKKSELKWCEFTQR